MKKEIKELLFTWYAINKRDLPWRTTNDPYKIWISEIILQQTRVAYGIDYFIRFTERFPNVKVLAEASADDVMRCWQGLGYYRRAMHLHAAARFIMEQHHGVFPDTYAGVTELQGVGSYTAAAICSIAYNLPFAVVDGNVYRILSRLFGVEFPIDSSEGKRYFAELANSLLDKENAGEYNQAIMDFGALQCTPQIPKCDNCPFKDECVAFLNDRTDFYPVKEKKSTNKNRYFNYIRINCNGTTLLNKRNENDIWHNLYEFPLIESDCEMDFQTLMATGQFIKLSKGMKRFALKSSIQMPKHQLTHQSIYATFYELECDVLPPMEGTITVPLSELRHYAISRLTENYLKKVKW